MSDGTTGPDDADRAPGHGSGIRSSLPAMRSPVPAVAVLLVLGGCNCNVKCGGGAEVDRTKANALVKTLADDVGAATAVECPADVQAVAGASFECAATFTGGGRQIAVVTITSVDGDDLQATARWRQPLLGAKQRAAVEASMADKLGVKATLHCKDDVIAVVPDQRVRCTVRGVAGDVPVDIWLGGDGDVGWKINPDAPDAPAGGAAAPAAPPTAEPPPEMPVEIPAEISGDPAPAPAGN
jgi:hypothetical protein